MQDMCNGSSRYLVLTAKHRTSFLHLLKPVLYGISSQTGLTLSETYLHLYWKIKDAICKTKDFLKLSQTVFSKTISQNHREITMLFLCQSLCQIIRIVMMKFAAKRDGSRYNTFPYVTAMSQTCFLTMKCLSCYWHECTSQHSSAKMITHTVNSVFFCYIFSLPTGQCMLGVAFCASST